MREDDGSKKWDHNPHRQRFADPPTLATFGSNQGQRVGIKVSGLGLGKAYVPIEFKGDGASGADRHQWWCVDGMDGGGATSTGIVVEVG